ncbi:shugoshin [Decorospora gaudefroyi]|uniref:Shugoshin n=1 Tax=Decorospora gaudefroyi TaxID=184978 RepID=A0A6A5KV33_9PLEO|nr:shugoshin [Decorospora gaudefroyi]
MARLNEPPIPPQPSAETIDAVKRRFLRQNRELAKTNSTQSIRIRSLENDCSRLLAENLALREQVLNLHNNIESRPALDHIDAVKMQLEAKIQELGGLVAGLAHMKNDKERRRKSHTTTRRKSSQERQWRSGLGLQEVENGMLPTISEDKFYPRRTMGADELQHVLEDPDSQSPDIGPPPVSRFENEDPIGFDPSPATEERQEEIGEDGEPALSVNLETRKKRRESGPKLNIRRVSVFESPEEAEEGAAKSLRTGAKRKFSVQEDEDRNQSKGDAFRFSRRNAPDALEAEASNEDTRPTSPGRPVLSAKPVNTDPVISPKKQRSSVSEKPDKPVQPTSKSRNRPRLNITRNAAPELPPLPLPDPVPTTEIFLDSLPPKTPAVEDIFSPPSTEPSTQRPESKDTPPPGDLSSSDQIGQAGRPGRRARPQVSYKEPSLSVKMRRPDAKLVDAVIDRRTSVETQAAPPTTVKREPDGELAFKPVSAVTRRAGEEEAEVGSPLRQKLDRRDQDTKVSPGSVPLEERSTAAKAISALISETSTARRKAAALAPPAAARECASEPTATKSHNRHDSMKDTIEVKQELQEKDKLAVFDFTDSSPADITTNSRTRVNELAKAARSARRHSAMPTSSMTTASNPEREERKLDKEKVDGALPSMHKRTGSGSVKSSSTTSLGRNPGANSLARSTSSARSASVKERKGTVSGGLPVSGSSIDLRAKVEGAEEVRAKTSTLRTERAASRRKSMLL